MTEDEEASNDPEDNIAVDERGFVPLPLYGIDLSGIAGWTGIFKRGPKSPNDSKMLDPYALLKRSYCELLESIGRNGNLNAKKMRQLSVLEQIAGGHVVDRNFASALSDSGRKMLGYIRGISDQAGRLDRDALNAHLEAQYGPEGVMCGPSLREFMVNEANILLDVCPAEMRTEARNGLIARLTHYVPEKFDSLLTADYLDNYWVRSIKSTEEINRAACSQSACISGNELLQQKYVDDPATIFLALIHNGINNCEEYLGYARFYACARLENDGKVYPVLAMDHIQTCTPDIYDAPGRTGFDTWNCDDQGQLGLVLAASQLMLDYGFKQVLGKNIWDHVVHESFGNKEATPRLLKLGDQDTYTLQDNPIEDSPSMYCYNFSFEEVEFADRQHAYVLFM